jgi:hypothetical protein
MKRRLKLAMSFLERVLNPHTTLRVRLRALLLLFPNLPLRSESRATLPLKQAAERKNFETPRRMATKAGTKKGQNKQSLAALLQLRAVRTSFC